MAIKTGIPNVSTTKMAENIEKIDELTKRLVTALAQRRMHDPKIDGPDQNLLAKASMSYFTEMMANPAQMIEKQAAYWSETLRQWSEAQQAVALGKSMEQPEGGTKDRRFKNPLWDTHPYFHMAKEQYLLSSKAIEEALDHLEGLDQDEQKRIQFFTRQIVDMMSPSNFLSTNPDALEKAVETEGQSLVDGLANLVRDIEANDGDLAVSLADPDAFVVGENIASTKGSVIFQNRMMQLLQFSPTTEKVRKTPLIIFPPWINKFYILDMKEKNSLIKYAVDQGFTVFVVSWVNPDGAYADVGMDTYMQEGMLKAINVVKEITKAKQVNVVGYCIAGTLLTLALGYLAKIGDNSIKNATYFTTMTDFEDPGELGYFLDEGFLEGIDNEVAERGYLGGFFMSRAFSYLRANDLVYGPAIRSYMLGEAPPAFDLLYWNGDSTNLPGRMAQEYLHSLYVENQLVNGEFTILGETVDMGDIQTPIYVIATLTDHIAPWKASFKGLNNVSGPKTFVLSESGHIAGIVNPASADKYGNWTNPRPYVDPDQWLEEASFSKKSWWHDWSKWLAKNSESLVAARKLGSPAYPEIEPAPGSYVKKKAK